MQRLRRRQPVPSLARGQHVPDPRGHLGRHRRDLVRLLVVRNLQALRKRQEADRGPAVTITRRQIGRAAERLTVRRQPDRHRPAAPALQEQLHRTHVDGVEIRPHLAVDLDHDVVLVQIPRDLLVVERLLLHHVTPVTGGIPDRQQDRSPERARQLERLVAPGVPVQRVVRMLTQIRAGFEEQSIDIARRPVVTQMPGAWKVVGRSRHPGGRQPLLQRRLEGGRARWRLERPGHLRPGLHAACQQPQGQKRQCRVSLHGSLIHVFAARPRNGCSDYMSTLRARRVWMSRSGMVPRGTHNCAARSTVP